MMGITRAFIVEKSKDNITIEGSVKYDINSNIQRNKLSKLKC